MFTIISENLGQFISRGTGSVLRSQAAKEVIEETVKHELSSLKVSGKPTDTFFMNTSAAVAGAATFATAGAFYKEYQYRTETVPQVKADIQSSHAAIKNARSDTEQRFKERAEHLKIRHEGDLNSLPKEGIFIRSPSPESIESKIKLHESKVGLEESTKKSIKDFLDRKEKAIPSEKKALDDSHWTSLSETYSPLDVNTLNVHRDTLLTSLDIFVM